MPIHFINNYAANSLETTIKKQDGSPQYGEIWLYKQFLDFNANGFVNDETWYLRHNYNLSEHPSGNGKSEGQIDFILLSKNGILIIEVKGGGIEVEEEIYYSKNKDGRYQTQNPFIQSKEYVHTLKGLLDSSPFIYHAVVFPHEEGFSLIGPQLSGYKHLFFSSKDLSSCTTDYARNEMFFHFINGLGKDSRKKIIKGINPTISPASLETKIWERFPQLNATAIKRLKSELFPNQASYGYDPERVRTEIILAENYEILSGLRKNRKVLVQGAPGTGKTVLATKFLAENLLKQQKGIFFCANKLLRSKMEYLMLNEYKLDANAVSFKIYTETTLIDSIDTDCDFIIFDEAQEFFDKKLFEFIEQLEERCNKPKILLLYDPEQTVIRDYIDIDWYTDFFMEEKFVHYYFDAVWRCTANPQIIDFSRLILKGQNRKIGSDFNSIINTANSFEEQMTVIKHITERFKSNTKISNVIILVESSLIEKVSEMFNAYFTSAIEELTETNINLQSQKLQYTTPIKYRGLESDHVIVITHGFNDKTRTQNFIACTRAICSLNLVVWN